MINFFWLDFYDYRSDVIITVNIFLKKFTRRLQAFSRIFDEELKLCRLWWPLHVTPPLLNCSWKSINSFVSWVHLKTLNQGSNTRKVLQLYYSWLLNNRDLNCTDPLGNFFKKYTVSPLYSWVSHTTTLGVKTDFWSTVGNLQMQSDNCMHCSRPFYTRGSSIHELGIRGGPGNNSLWNDFPPGYCFLVFTSASKMHLCCFSPKVSPPSCCPHRHNP